MKKIFLLSLTVLLMFTMVGCEDFLNQPPYDDFTDAEYWKNEDQARTFMYGFYTSIFSGYGSGASHGQFLMGQTSNDDFASDVEQQDLTPLVVPEADGSWSFTNIRKANYVLENIDRIDATVAAKNHWRGVARFFRACYYSNLVFRYGDVPWYDRVPSLSDNDYLYKDRDPRTYVDSCIMADFQYAMDSVRANDGNLQINKYVVAAMASRFMLREGTFLKYHNLDLDMAEQCLTMAKAAAEMVMNSGKYAIAPSYKSLFVSEDLSSNPEIIMYRQYEDGLLAHSTLAYSYTEAQAGLSKSLAEDFVNANGLPIYYNNTNWVAKTSEEFFANRDPRLTMCIRDHYCIKGESLTPFNYALSGYAWNKFMDDSKAGETNPTWAKEKNTTDAPCLRYAEVLLNYAEAAYELHLLTGATFAQADLDKSINLIRARADVNLPALQMAGDQPAINGVTFDDPKRLQMEQIADGGETPALLWEIRRERRVELCLEGFRLNDLKRWCKLDYLWNGCNPDIRYGAYIRASDYKSKAAEIVIAGKIDPMTNDTVTNEGYILRNTLGKRNRPIKRNYINPIPSGQITLYKSKGYTLSQNTEWGW
ncbi:MAG: RagB/SusD family nutrient uptake outer membrane protein [Paludibacteraceae bacterium]|nr:RagB/SusD family nutrient uptake outer membrane protein [Paludibacteraceae bacterium]